MASFSSLCLSNQQLVSFLLIITFFSNVIARPCIKSIISFGDSTADTGNSVSLGPNDTNPSAFPPYGETYFKQPTGRFCNGRLVIDFLAQKLGLPLVPPYFGTGNDSSQKFLNGVNFAVAGATALDNEVLVEKGINTTFTIVPLRDQMRFFKESLPSLCTSSSACNQLLKSSLILMEEIGVNDFNYAFSQGFGNKVLRELVPVVIKAISSSILELIDLGAKTFLVPGILPIGCLPSSLGSNQTYDHYGCLIWLNEVVQYHNERLRKELNEIRSLHPGSNILYADYYQAVIQFYLSLGQFGFNSTLSACCGAGGPYNYNSSTICSKPGTKSCDDPSLYVSWDGIHLTERSNQLISYTFLDGLKTLCA